MPKAPLRRIFHLSSRWAGLPTPVLPRWRPQSTGDWTFFNLPITLAYLSRSIRLGPDADWNIFAQGIVPVFVPLFPFVIMPVILSFFSTAFDGFAHLTVGDRAGGLSKKTKQTVGHARLGFFHGGIATMSLHICYTFIRNFPGSALPDLILDA